MVLIVTELKEKKVLAILDGTSNEIVTGRLKRLPDEVKKKIV